MIIMLRALDFLRGMKVRIEKGVQPNCSEVVIYLDFTDYDMLVNALGILGIALVPESGAYVDGSKMQEIYQKKVQDLKNIITNPLSDEGTKKFAEERLEAVTKGVAFVDMGNPGVPDAQWGASFWIGHWPEGQCNTAKEEEDDFPECDLKCGAPLAIWYHQHSQKQGYATIDKICEAFGAKAHGYDGGYYFEIMFYFWKNFPEYRDKEWPKDWEKMCVAAGFGGYMPSDVLGILAGALEATPAKAKKKQQKKKKKQLVLGDPKPMVEVLLGQGDLLKPTLAEVAQASQATPPGKSSPSLKFPSSVSPPRLLSSDAALQDAIKSRVTDSALLSKFKPLRHTTLDEPIMVRDVNGYPNYWLVPCYKRYKRKADQCRGFFLYGTMGPCQPTYVASYGDGPVFPSCPTFVSQEDAEKIAHDHFVDEYGDVDSELGKLFWVFDGELTNQAWMAFVTNSAGEVLGRVFVRGYTVYDKKA